MKKLHLFILKSYLGPLAMTFFISLFILVMQFLWRYVDDLVGKGLEITVIAELMFFASVQVIPMALPLAILLASLMTFGNMGENYELTAIKAAGVSLPKAMKSLITVTLITAVAAFWFTNNVLPIANLKLYSLLWSVKTAKPELDIKEQIFYDGFEDYRIKISHKDAETNLLHDLMIYDHRDRLNRNSNVTMADSGRIQLSEDKKHMVLTLMDGVTYEENVDRKKKRLRDRDKQQFRIDRFKKQTALVPMQGYDFTRTDEKLFTHSDKMKNLQQLVHDEDSIQQARSKIIGDLSRRTENFFFLKGKYAYRSKTNRPMPQELKEADKKVKKEDPMAIIDSVQAINTDSLFLSLANDKKRMSIQSALRQARDNKNLIDDQLRFIGNEDEKIIRHNIELHRKFTLSFACLIFFFIGAPLGAIIRKGGLGMPVVISILFFIFYYIIDTMGLKFAKEGVWPVYQGIWLSSAILFPLGVFLTYKAASDSALLNADAYIIFFRKLFKREKYDLKNRLDNDEN